MTDFLLLNAGNYAGNLIFPYAFVQVRALARLHGLAFASYDLFGLDPQQAARKVEELVRQHAPRMVGLHVRQADSIFLKDYATLQADASGYFPLHSAQRVIRQLRCLTTAPIAVGGFGFTTYLEPVLRLLEPDFGIAGEPDDLFAKFELALRGDYAAIRNAVWLEQGGLRCAERCYFPPLPVPEYDEEVLAEMEKFYSRSTLYGKDQPTVAVELARGCPFSCYFCSEPHVKGREVRQRDMDVVMADVEFLAARGIRRFWLVCSELNIGNNRLALAVAQRFRDLNQRYAPHRIRWQAYHLPRWLSREDMQTLYDAGFDGGWNDFPSLEDANLVDCRVPYRGDDVVFHLRTKAQIHHYGPNGTPAYLSLFLGNAYATPATIAVTLRRLHAAGLGSRYPNAEIGLATRLFPFHLTGKFPAPPGAEQAFSVASDGSRQPADIALPTFFYAPAIRAEFASDEELSAFADYLCSALLSDQYRRNRDWAAFAQRSLQRPWFRQYWKTHARAAEQLAADPGALVATAAESPSLAFQKLLAALGLRPLGEETPYRALQVLLPRYEGPGALLADLERRFGIDDNMRECWLLDHYLFSLDVRLQPALRKFVLCETP